MFTIKRHIGDYNFIADSRTGMTARWGKSFDDDPYFAPVPELADISISNYCTKGCSFCYKNSTKDGTIMSIESYCKVLDALNHPIYGNVFQVALGGGEPLEHPQFNEIINATVERNIVPNFTTNGIHMTDEIATFCLNKVGAIAVSTDSVSNIQHKCIKILIDKGIRTNVHYVLQNDNIHEATEILLGKYDDEFKGINAIIFLTFKPAGRGDEEHVIREDFRYLDFLKAIKNKKSKIKIGFDACFVPNLLHYKICNTTMMDSCESAFFSVYIDENCNVSPCSFSGTKDKYSLKEFNFYDIWLNKFESYRNKVTNKCTRTCSFKKQCRGYCQYYPQITICYNED